MRNGNSKLGWASGANLNVDPRSLQPGEVERFENLVPTADGKFCQKRPAVNWHPSTQLLDTLAVLIHYRTCLPRALYPLNPAIGRAMALYAANVGITTPVHPALLMMSDGDPDASGDFRIADKLAAQLAFRPSATDYRTLTNFCFGGEFEGFVDCVPAGPLNTNPGSGAVNTPSLVRASFVFGTNSLGGATVNQCTGPVGIGQTQIIPVCPRLNARQGPRMVYANFGPGMENWLCFADFNHLDSATPHNPFATAPFVNGVQIPWYIPIHCVIGNDALAYNGPHLPLDLISGESLRAVHEVMLAQVGSQLESALVCLTLDSCVFVTGKIPQSYEILSGVKFDAYGVDTKRVNYRCGITAKETLVRTKFGLLWAGDDEVWALPTGSAPVPVGTKLSPLLKNCPASGHQHWFAVEHEGFYKLSIATSVNSDPSADDTLPSDEIPIWEQWWLDLRSGLPQSWGEAKWYGPMTYDKLCAGATVEQETGEGFAYLQAGTVVNKRFLCPAGNTRVSGILSSVLSAYEAQTAIVDMGGTGTVDYAFRPFVSANEWAPFLTIQVGDSLRPTPLNATGRVYVVTAVTTGITGATEPAWPTSNLGTVVDDGVTWTEVTGFNQYGLPVGIGGQGRAGEVTGVLMDLIMRDEDFGDAMLEKTISRIELNSRAALNREVSIALNEDQGARVDTAVTDDLAGSDDESTVLGLTTLDSGRLSHEFVARQITTDVQAPVKCRTVQLRVTDASEIVIDDSNDTLLLSFVENDNQTFLPNAQNVRQAPAILPHGSYTLAELLTALTTALTDTMAGWSAAVITGQSCTVTNTHGLITFTFVYVVTGQGPADVTNGTYWALLTQADPNFGYPAAVDADAVSEVCRRQLNQSGLDMVWGQQEAASGSSSEALGIKSTVCASGGTTCLIAGIQSVWPFLPSEIELASPINLQAKVFDKPPFTGRFP